MTQISYNKREAAAQTGASVRTIERAIAAGQLPASQPKIKEDGTRADLVLIKHDDLEAWAAGR